MAARFLTSSKIALAFLVKVYCNGYIPPQAELPVLQFLISHINPEITDFRSVARQPRSNSYVTGRFEVTLQDLKDLLQTSTTKYIDPDTTLIEDKDVWYILTLYLCALSDFDSLLEEVRHSAELFIENKESGRDTENELSLAANKSLLKKGIHRSTKLEKWSLLGIFTRRVMVEFERLRFDDAIQLWRKFEQYRAPLMHECSRKQAALKSSFLELESMNNLSGGKLFQILENSFQDQDGTMRLASSVDIEKMLEFQVHQIQKNGARMPLETKQRINNLIGSAAEDSNLLSYIRFLEAWYKGDYTMSFEYLHRYYDYAMQHTDRFHYQYALLNMAILQADFGSFDEATAAMKETIATARENKDMHCLNYCLSWLYHFYIKQGDQPSNLVEEVLQGANSGQGLQYLKATARDHNMHSVEAQVALLDVGESLAMGQRPLAALEKLYEASHLVLDHQLENAKASQILIHASIYARLGAMNLSRSLNSLVIDCHGVHPSQEELVNARCRNAYIDALLGRYESALNALKTLRHHGSTNIRLDQLVLQYMGVIELKRKLHHHNLYEAERLIATLKSTRPANPDLSFIVSLFEIDLQVRHGNLPQAWTSIEAIFQKLEGRTRSDAYQMMRLLNSKSFLFAKAGRGSKGFSIALRSVIGAYKIKNAVVLWESVAAFVGLLVGMREWSAAAEVAGSAIYRTTETEEISIAASLRKSGVDALLGQASTVEDEDRRRELMKLALRWTMETSQMYKDLEEYKGICEVNVKARTILSYLGDQEASKELESEYYTTKAMIGT